MKRAAVITISDKGSKGERVDTSGPELVKILESDNWEVVCTKIIPDDFDVIKSELLKCSDEMRITLILTTGGTGFSPRDVTPEATLSVIERETRGIPEAMRAESMRITPMGCLSRSFAGIAGRSLIINLPGSPKAVKECMEFLMHPLEHGLEIMLGRTGECARP